MLSSVLAPAGPTIAVRPQRVVAGPGVAGPFVAGPAEVPTTGGEPVGANRPVAEPEKAGSAATEPGALEPAVEASGEAAPTLLARR